MCILQWKYEKSIKIHKRSANCISDFSWIRIISLTVDASPHVREKSMQHSAEQIMSLMKDFVKSENSHVNDTESMLHITSQLHIKEGVNVSEWYYKQDGTFFLIFRYIFPLTLLFFSMKTILCSLSSTSLLLFDISLLFV